MTLVHEAVPELAAAWAGAVTITALDGAVPPRHIVRDVALGDGLTADVAVLRHPCTWTNAPRAGCDGRGLVADAAVLRRAVAASAGEPVTCATEPAPPLR